MYSIIAFPRKRRKNASEMNWKLVLFNLKLHEEEDENKKQNVSLTDTTHMRLCSHPRILSSRLRKGEKLRQSDNQELSKLSRQHLPSFDRLLGRPYRMFDLQLAAKKNQLLSRFDRSLQTPESKMER